MGDTNGDSKHPAYAPGAHQISFKIHRSEDKIAKNVKTAIPEHDTPSTEHCFRAPDPVQSPLTQPRSWPCAGDLVKRHNLNKSVWDGPETVRL